MSMLTPQEQVGFHRQKGWKVLAYAGFFVLFALAYFFLFGPWMQEADENGGRVNAIMFAYYEAFGITTGALVLLGVAAVVALFSIKHFREAEKIKRSSL